MYLIERNGRLWFHLAPTTDALLVGSHPTQASLFCQDDTISPVHAQLTYEQGQWWLEDLKSKEGTNIDGKPLAPEHKQSLKQGALITFGLTEFVFSQRAPLHLSEATPALPERLAPLTELTEAPGIPLALLPKLTSLLSASADAAGFADTFLAIIDDLFQPKQALLYVEEQLYQSGSQEPEPIVDLVLHQTRFQMQPQAFSSNEEGEERFEALYAPIEIEELISGRFLVLSAPGASWQKCDFDLFAALALFAEKGLSAFHVLHRAQEDREVLHLNLVGIATEMQHLKTQLLQLAQKDLPILIEGEEGVGKSRIARAIHQASPRRQAPLIVLNAANFPKELFESALCGVVVERESEPAQERIGKIEQAHGGSFLLEEIGELPLGIQPTLLGLLQSGQFVPVGADEPKQAQVRMIFTSGRSLEQLAREGKLIPELVAKLSSNVLKVPSLRQRQEDIPQLFRAFLGRFGEEEGLPTSVVSDDALEHLKSHEWSYNIRELRDIVARCFYELDPAHPVVDEALILRVLEAHQASRKTEHKNVLGQKVRELEQRLIQEALMAANDDIVAAARTLGVSRVVLWRKMRELAIG